MVAIGSRECPPWRSGTSRSAQIRRLDDRLSRSNQRNLPPTTEAKYRAPPKVAQPPVEGHPRCPLTGPARQLHHIDGSTTGARSVRIAHQSRDAPAAVSERKKIIDWPNAAGEDWKDVEDRPRAGDCATCGRSESLFASGLRRKPGSVARSHVSSAIRVASHGAKRISDRTSTSICRFLIGIRRSSPRVLYPRALTSGS
jgi:hypothetical protein